MFDKESVYDERISPLMGKIIAICKEHEIPVVASFLLKSPDTSGGNEQRCTTALVGFEHTPDDFRRMNAIARFGWRG